MNNSDTPRTDEEIIKPHGCNSPEDYHVPAEFARQLERELAAKERELNSLTGAFGLKCQRIVELLEDKKTLQTVARELADEVKNETGSIPSFYTALPPEVKGLDKS